MHAWRRCSSRTSFPSSMPRFGKPRLRPVVGAAVVDRARLAGRPRPLRLAQGGPEPRRGETHVDHEQGIEAHARSVKETVSTQDKAQHEGGTSGGLEAWTTDRVDRWIASPGTVIMKPEVDSAYFFVVHYEGVRHPHYGRFLRLEPDRLIQMTWLTAAGTAGMRQSSKSS